MKKRLLILFATLPFSIITCNDDSRTSLVGDWSPPSESESAGEMVKLWLGTPINKRQYRYLSVVFEQDSLSQVEQGIENSETEGVWLKRPTRTFFLTRISSKVRSDVIRQLIRLRPWRLDGPYVVPRGCSFIHDQVPWGGITFLRGSHVGVFNFQPGCSGVGAEESRRVLRAVLTKLSPMEDWSVFVPNGG